MEEVNEVEVKEEKKKGKALQMVEEPSKPLQMVESLFLDDFIALKSHVIVQNDERYEFKEGLKASETNQSKIPARFQQTLMSEAVIKGE